MLAWSGRKSACIQPELNTMTTPTMVAEKVVKRSMSSGTSD